MSLIASAPALSTPQPQAHKLSLNSQIKHIDMLDYIVHWHAFLPVCGSLGLAGCAGCISIRLPIDL
jgi:hypothetical protein